MNITFRATDKFMDNVRKDLVRAHAFALERVGFISVRAANANNDLVLIAQDYHPVSDNDYIYDNSVGALIGPEGLRKALEISLLNPVGMLHVHMHLFPGRLWFSSVDLREQLKFVPDFFKVRSTMPHGALVLSPYKAAGRVWVSPSEIVRISEFVTVGSQVKVSLPAKDGSTDFYV